MLNFYNRDRILQRYSEGKITETEMARLLLDLEVAVNTKTLAGWLKEYSRNVQYQHQPLFLEGVTLKDPEDVYELKVGDLISAVNYAAASANTYLDSRY